MSKIFFLGAYTNFKIRILTDNVALQLEIVCYQATNPLRAIAHRIGQQGYRRNDRLYQTGF